MVDFYCTPRMVCALRSKAGGRLQGSAFWQVLITSTNAKGTCLGTRRWKATAHKIFLGKKISKYKIKAESAMPTLCQNRYFNMTNIFQATE